MTHARSMRNAAFAACCCLLSAAAAWAQPATGTVSPFNGSGAPGTQQSIAITASDSGGWQNISHLDVLINSVGSGSNACFFVYFPNLNSIYLEHDIPDSGWAGYADVGNHTGSASNSHCTIYGSGSSISQSGSVLTLTFNVSFAFTGGTLYYWEHVVENSGADSGWWQIVIGGSPASFLVQSPNQPPSVGTVTPANESIAANTSTNLQFTGTDPNGYSDVAEMDVLITPDGSSGCFWVFFPNLNAVYLVQNTSPFTWSPVGVNGNNSYPSPASSSSCTVSPSGSTSSGAGVTETLHLNLSFPSSFAGTKSYWQQIKDQSNATSNWQQIAGAITITQPPVTISGISPASGPVGTSVTITGTNFGATQGSSTVKFNGTLAAVNSWSATSIIALVPSGAITGSVMVTVNNLSATSGVLFQVQVPATPTITTLSLPSGPPQVGFVISGANFGAAQGSVTLTGLSGGDKPLTVINWSPILITVQVPNATPLGAGQVYVKTSANAASNLLPFTVSQAFACTF